jgi:hypothetical protein
MTRCFVVFSTKPFSGKRVGSISIPSLRSTASDLHGIRSTITGYRDNVDIFTYVVYTTKVEKRDVIKAYLKGRKSL